MYSVAKFKTEGYIPELLDPSFTIGEPLGSEDILNTCKGTDCKYITKMIPIIKRRISPCYSHEDVVRNEILISQIAGDSNIGPRIYSKSIDKNKGALIMDKYDGDLDMLMNLYQDGVSVPIVEIMSNVTKLIQKLHDINIVHRAIHPGNIFYTKEGIIALGDYGSALISDAKALQDEDWSMYNAIANTINSVGQDDRSWNEIYRQLALRQLSPVKILFNNELCDYQNP